jgi:uncharacterized protein YdeI (YjbR/CyaY-like superfamily)
MRANRPTQPKKSRAAEDLERIEVKSRAALRKWLSANHTQKKSVWCVTWKKRPGAPHIPYADIVEEALCFGWIDSLPRALDGARSMLLLSPRKASSNWSNLNKRRAEEMIAAGAMTPAGLTLIAAAKTNGKWTFLDDVDALTEPPDLKVALKAVSSAATNWQGFPPSARRGILEWIKNAKTPETRQRRIAETAALAGKNIRANQYRQKLPAAAAAKDAGNRQKSKA